MALLKAVMRWVELESLAELLDLYKRKAPAMSVNTFIMPTHRHPLGSRGALLEYAIVYSQGAPFSGFPLPPFSALPSFDLGRWPV